MAGLKDAYASFLLEEKERSSRTAETYLYRWKVVEEKAGKPIQELSTEDLFALKRVLREAGYSSAHIKGLFVAVRQVRKWGVVTGRWPQNGVEHVPIPREVNNSSRPLPLDKVRLILGVAADPYELRATYVPSYGGLRVEEAAGLETWQDGWLDFIGKGGKPRQVPVHPCLEARRDAILSRPTPHRGTLQSAKERIEERVGFRFVIHQLRKSFSTALHNEGVSSLCRRKLMGHSLGLDGVYTDVSEREQEEAIAVLPY